MEAEIEGKKYSITYSQELQEHKTEKDIDRSTGGWACRAIGYTRYARTPAVQWWALRIYHQEPGVLKWEK